MLKKLAIASLCALSAAAFITGCGSSQKPASSAAASAPAEKKEITVGATAGPHAEVVEAAAKEAEKNGLKVNVKEFSDYITPDQALADGDLDIVVYQHKPFMENFNKQHGTHLTDIGRAILMRMGIYSNKVKDVKDLPDGATISIPNDPTNEGRGLQLLEKAGVIKLKEGVGMKATPADVVENPKNIQFKEIEAAQLPRSLDDVDASVITMNYVMSAGLSPEKQGIFLEDKDTPLAVMIIAVRERIRISQPIRNSFRLISLTLLRNSLLKNTKAPSFLPGTNRLLKQKALEKFPFPKLFYWDKPDKPDVQGIQSSIRYLLQTFSARRAILSWPSLLGWTPSLYHFCSGGKAFVKSRTGRFHSLASERRNF